MLLRRLVLTCVAFVLAKGSFVEVVQNIEMRVPWFPKRSSQQAVSTTTFEGVVGLAFDGVLIQNEHVTGWKDEEPQLEEPTDSFDGCGGHIRHSGVYHYHLPPLCLLNKLGIHIDPADPAQNSAPRAFGVALDGFPILAPVPPGIVLDRCNGHNSSDGYRYYMRSQAPFFPQCLRGKLNSEPLHRTEGETCSLRSAPSDELGTKMQSDGLWVVHSSSGCPPLRQKGRWGSLPEWLEVVKRQWLSRRGGASTGRSLTCCKKCGCQASCHKCSNHSSNCSKSKGCGNSSNKTKSCGKGCCGKGCCGMGCSKGCCSKGCYSKGCSTGCGSGRNSSRGCSKGCSNKGCSSKGCSAKGCSTGCGCSSKGCSKGCCAKGCSSGGGCCSKGCAAVGCGRGGCGGSNWFTDISRSVQIILVLASLGLPMLLFAAAVIKLMDKWIVPLTFVCVTFTLVVLPIPVLMVVTDTGPLEAGYWGIQTLATIGYGDVKLESDVLKIFAAIYSMIGMTFGFILKKTFFDIAFKEILDEMDGTRRFLKDILKPLIPLLLVVSVFSFYWGRRFEDLGEAGTPAVNGVYFVLTTISTVGFGDLTPNGPTDCIMFGLMIVTGVPTFFFFLGALSRFVGQRMQAVIVYKPHFVKACRDRVEKLRKSSGTDIQQQKEVEQDAADCSAQEYPADSQVPAVLQGSLTSVPKTSQSSSAVVYKESTLEDIEDQGRSIPPDSFYGYGASAISRPAHI